MSRSDRAIFDSTLTTPTNGSCVNADPGAYQCIGPTFFDSYGGFPDGTLYSHNFNLATWNSSGFATLKSTVPLACKALRGQLEGFEIGNEPDLYKGSRRPSNYSVDNYVSQWLNEKGRFETYFREACPNMVKDIKYIFPSVSSPGSSLPVPDIMEAAGEGTKLVRQISVHNYMGGATQPGVTLQATLMNHTAVANSINSHVDYAQSISDPSAQYVIGEQNSLYGGGADGLSNVFGAALWGMDFSLYAASTEIIKRIHFHQSVGSPYSAWSPVEPLQTLPPYYGQLASSTFLANSDRIQVKVLSLGGNKDLDSGYTASIGSRVERIAMINLRQFNSTSGEARGSQMYTVNASPRSRWTVKRLTAPGALDMSNITFNGYAYDADSVGQPVRVAGTTSNEKTEADWKGNIAVTVADSEAVVLLSSS